jgi:hypothetical protein
MSVQVPNHVVMVPAVLCLKTVFYFVLVTRSQRVAPYLASTSAVVGMEQVVPHIEPQAISQGIACVIDPPLVEI